jgi:hypothetical protein
MKIRSLILLFLLPLCSSTFGRINNYVVPSEIPLAMPLAKHLEDQQVTQIRSYLVQHDNWSCGLRTAFHALAIEQALKDPNNFEATLKHNLQNAALLDTLDARYGNNKGLSNNTIEKIAEDFGINHKILCLHAEDNNRIKYLGSISYPGHASKAEVQRIFEHTKNQKLQELTDIAKNTPQAVYIVAGSEDHWVLFALVNLPGRPAKLYLIDSNNVGMTPKRQLFVDLLLPYLKEINKGIPAQPAARPAGLSSAVTAHLVNKIKPTVTPSPIVQPAVQDTKPAPMPAPQTNPAVQYPQKKKHAKRHIRRKAHRKHKHKKKITPALWGLWQHAKKSRKPASIGNCQQQRSSSIQNLTPKQPDQKQKSPCYQQKSGARSSCPFAWAIYQKCKKKS